MYIKKKKYKKLLEDLKAADTAAFSWRAVAESTKKDMGEWRARYELSQLNPEVKADTEAAFQRGAIYAKQQILNNLLVMTQNLNTEMPKEDRNA